MSQVQSLMFREKLIVVISCGYHFRCPQLFSGIQDWFLRTCLWNAWCDFGIKDHLEWWTENQFLQGQIKSIQSQSSSSKMHRISSSMIFCWANPVWWFDAYAMLPARALSISDTNIFLDKGVSTLALCGIARYYLWNMFAIFIQWIPVKILQCLLKKALHNFM